MSARRAGSLLALSAGAVWAQATEQMTLRHTPVTPGTVTGHVTIEDTSAPARFASVTLQPVVTPETPADTAKDKGDDRGVVTALRIVHTTLDGSFLVSNVAPGNYYVMVDAGPYLSAAGVLTRE